MADNHNKIVSVLVKYALRQPLTEEEERLLEQWRSRSAEHREIPDRLRDPQWRETHRQELQDAPSEEMWENIRGYIREKKEAPAPAGYRMGTGNMRIGRPRIGWKWIAAASVVLTGGLIWLIYPAKPVTNPVAQAKPSAAPPALARASETGLLLSIGDRTLALDNYHPGDTLSAGDGLTVVRQENAVVYTGYPDRPVRHILSVGRRKSALPFKLVFPDGSTVYADTSTRIDYSPGMWDDAVIHVDGEAMFNITRNRNHIPLLVVGVRKESVTVLGTSFDFLSRIEGKQSRTEVYTGKVRVKSDGDSVILRPATAALMTEGKAPEVQRLEGGQDLPAWIRPPVKGPYFEFQNTPLPAALNEVAQYYVKTVSNPHGVKGIPISGKLPHSESLDNTLRAIEKVQNGRAFLRRKGDAIVVLQHESDP